MEAHTHILYVLPQGLFSWILLFATGNHTKKGHTLPKFHRNNVPEADSGHKILLYRMLLLLSIPGCGISCMRLNPAQPAPDIADFQGLPR